MEKDGKENKKELTVQVGERLFYYIGDIISEDDNFLNFNDRILGGMRINKKSIIKISGVKE